MSRIDRKELFNTATDWTREAGEYIRKKMKESFSVNTKSNQDDLVTDVDKGVENFFEQKLSDKLPDHTLMGEEGTAESVKNLDGTVWILDPIDGTMNFVHQESFFAVSLGIFENGEGIIGIVYDVMNDEMFSCLKGEGAYVNGRKLPELKEVPVHESILSFNSGWILKDRRLEKLVKESRGTRSYGSAALELAYVAAGRLDAYISFNLAPWDIAGGYVLIKEVGSTVTNYEGKDLDFLNKGTLLAANPYIHNNILSLIHEYDQ
ncbi:inositol monophosphatase family protein [Evansella clarkii]|uniref:inositol monophosphatase family protein n=1 Tax=Evansella clarkii TaxID=79879 RepID=UPI000B43F668|nr:inositol monophosphatase family protein [Evansella clarkii]